MYRQCCNNSCNTCSNDEMFEQSCMMSQIPYSPENSDSCSCGFEQSDIFPNTLLYGNSYVPHQYMNNIYRPNIGLKMGTIFTELVSPYCPGQSQEIMNILRQNRDFEGGCM